MEEYYILEKDEKLSICGITGIRKTLLMEQQLIFLNDKNIKAIKNERNPITVLSSGENLWHC